LTEEEQKTLTFLSAVEGSSASMVILGESEVENLPSLDPDGTNIFRDLYDKVKGKM